METKTIKTKRSGEVVKNIALSAVLAALCFVFTGYFHIPTGNGITHIGDGIIFLAACLLPLPYAAAVGAIGAGMADILTGFAIWAPATVVIKSLTVLLFSRKGEKIITLRNILAIIPAFLICACGYVAYEALVISDFKVAVLQVPFYGIQIAFSSVVYILLGIGLDKIGFKKKA